MATRFYWGQVITAPAPTFSATWSAPGSTPTRLLMRTVKRKATVTPIVASATETTAAILNKQAVQLISMPLAAQTITGTVKGYALFSESDTAQDCRVQCEIRIISQGGTVRGTLLASDIGGLSSEFTATPTNRRIPLLAATNTLTSVTAQEGDYLVVEIGHRTNISSPTSYTVTVRWNDDPGSTDLPEDETDTDTAKAPWIEFSQDLVVSDYFEENALTYGTASSTSAEPLNPFIPDVAQKISYDILSDFSTPTLPNYLAIVVSPVVNLVPGDSPSLYFEENVLATAKASSASAEPLNPFIPDVAQKISYDILADFGTPTLPNYLAIEAPVVVNLVPGNISNLLYFEENALVTAKSSSTSAEPLNPFIPDVAQKISYDILADFGTPTLTNYLTIVVSPVVNLVAGNISNLLYFEQNALVTAKASSTSAEPTKASTSNLDPRTRYVNRVYDSVAVKLVRWVTTAIDNTGSSYPGPGVFGVTTLDYVVEYSYTV